MTKFSDSSMSSFNTTLSVESVERVLVMLGAWGTRKR